jgi:hypothetical protein
VEIAGELGYSRDMIQKVGASFAVDFSSLADDGDLESMSVPDLQKCCKELGLKTKGRKRVLVARVKSKVEWRADPK